MILLLKAKQIFFKKIYVNTINNFHDNLNIVLILVLGL